MSATMHWSTESVYAADVQIPIFNESLDISVSAEVPMLDTERQPRRGNRYFPTLITVDGPSDYSMHPETARELAKRLIEAADAADAIDQPDTDACGHWAPCSVCRGTEPPSQDQPE